LLAAAKQRRITLSEARATIKSGLDAGERNPRDLSRIETLGSPPRAPAVRETKTCLTDDEERRRKRAREILRASQRIGGTPAEAYLQSRGISLIGEPVSSLRSHERLPMPGDNYLHPCMVAPVIVPMSGEFLGIQRTALRSDGKGKAEILIAKASLGPTKGGAVVFGELEAGAEILEGEGVETVLSAVQATGLPGIATLGAVALGKPQVPPGRPIVILADLGSEAAARAGAQRRYEQGRAVRIMYPRGGVR
jgi:hypothetical protein